MECEVISQATTVDLAVFRTQNTEFRTFYDVIHENEFHGFIYVCKEGDV